MPASYYCDYENLSYLTKEHIVYGLERKQDGVRFFSKNKDVYVIYFSKDPWKEERIHIWFEMFNKDISCQGYEFVLENGYDGLTNELLERDIPHLLKQYINDHIEALYEDLELL